MEEISSNPDAYARYLEIQGDNPCTVPEILPLLWYRIPISPSLVLWSVGKPWAGAYRKVNAERVYRFFPGPPLEKATLWYRLDISQTTGREIKKPVLQDGSLAMESALSTLLNYSIVPVVVTGMDVPAFYDEGSWSWQSAPLPGWRSLWGHCDRGGPQSVPCQGRKHHYNRSESELDAQSVSYILCKRFESSVICQTFPLCRSFLQRLDAPGSTAGAGHCANHEQKDGKLHRAEYCRAAALHLGQAKGQIISTALFKQKERPQIGGHRNRYPNGNRCHPRGEGIPSEPVPLRLDDCWRNRPRASQCAHWLGLDQASPLEYRAYQGGDIPQRAQTALDHAGGWQRL